MKKLYIILLFIATISVDLLNANQRLNLTQEEKEFIKNNNTIKVHNELDWAPYNYNVDGVPYGYSIDYMRLLASKVGFKVDFIHGYDWNQFMNMLKANKIDVMLNITKTKQREKYFNFTTPYINQSDALFIRKKGTHYKNLKELEGKTISVVKGFFQEEILKEYYPKIKLIEVKDSTEALKLVSLGKVEATINNIGAGSFLIAKHGLLNLVPILELKDKLFLVNLNIATNKQNIILRNILEKSKKTITNDEIVRLTKKWLSYDNNLRTSFTLEEEAYLKEKKVITMCIDPNWMPFEQFDHNGNYIGISADYFNHFENIMKLKFKVIKTKTWKESLEFVKNKQCDILSLAMETAKRKKFLNFTKPYLQVPIVLATKFNVSFIENLAALENRKIAITKGYAFIELIKKKYPDMNFIEVDNIEEGLIKVQKDEVFGYLGALATIGYTIQNNFIEELKIAGKFNEDWKLGIAVRNDDKTLLHILEKTINSVSASKRQKIFNNWIQISYKEKIDYSLFYLALIFILFIIIFFFYKQYLNNKLEKELKSKLRSGIKKLRKKDKMLFHQSKLASMGEMIENIAHQWRQPLSQINSSVLVIDDILEEHNFNDSIISKKLSKIEFLTNYLSTTIDDFQQFFNKNKRKENFIIQDMITQAIFLMQDLAKKYNTKIILQSTSNFKCHGYKSELQQSIIVMLNNALDAFSNIDITDKTIIISTNMTNSHYSINICDNAGGIDKKIINKIFEPYFTTKHKTQGSGLGLYMAKRIIEENLNGTLDVVNRNNGACFQIKIKRVIQNG